MDSQVKSPKREAVEFLLIGVACTTIGGLRHATWFGWFGALIGGASLALAMWAWERHARAKLAEVEETDE